MPSQKFNNSFWIIICILLFVINLYTFYQNNNLKEALDTIEASSSENIELANNLLNDILKKEILESRSEGIIVNTNLVLTSEKQEELLLSEISLDQPKVIIDFSSISCSSCGEETFKEAVNLTKKLEDRLGADNVILIANYKNYTDLDVFKRINSISSQIYNKNYQKMGLPVEQVDSPFVFLLNSEF
jgi:hypothetical protein